MKDHQCESDEDCVALLGGQYVCDDKQVCQSTTALDAGPPPLPEAWTCLRENLPTYPPLTEEDMMRPPQTVSLLLRDFSTGDIILDSLGSSCRSIDIDCSRPLESELTPDSEGYTHFTVPYGFLGRFRFIVPDRMPSVVYFSRPILRDYREHGSSPLSQDTRASLLARASTDIPDESGLVLFVLLDCEDQPAPGLRLVSEGPLDSVPFYFDGPFPDQQLTVSRLTTALSPDGKSTAVGGFYDPPGFTSYASYLDATDDLVSRVSVDVRADELTVVFMYPGDG